MDSLRQMAFSPSDAAHSVATFRVPRGELSPRGMVQGTNVHYRQTGTNMHFLK